MAYSKLCMLTTAIALLAFLTIERDQVASVETFINPSQNLNDLSEELLTRIKNKQQTNQLRTKLYTIPLETLQNSLKTDDQKLAFWINIYNAYIQIKLTEQPSLYKDRDAFFKKDQIPIAGRLVSFDKIEHGIIRKSQWKLGLGLVGKWFPDKFERELRVEENDYRIHFALNCGAQDCPPVAIYKPEKLDKQLEKSTKNYLQKTSTFNPTTGEAKITSLFSWFRGDFGLESGIEEILKKYGIIPTTENISLTYKDYDWTLDLNNWSEL
ncbi:DUF547 domain-containing protein [Pareuzebyella sediminis]|uniref:DUF547 domain-containing protein n=1 Tax=Pareuzebyella sediminis TaxID=2607998 RepID=UPI001E3DE4B7|nr:DUF547 domain-containing protein [Pareuzebyella sediminis]